MYKDRHLRTERNCERCGKSFMAQNSRIKLGQGRFCSLECARLFTQENDLNNVRGKEKGKKYWDGNRWIIRWYDDEGVAHTTSYQRWWWEINNDIELPKNIYVVLKDGNRENISPNNFVLMSKSELSILRGQRGTGSPKPTIAGSLSKWWRGGSSYDGYPTTFSKPLKKRIKIRDNYTCQCCYSQMESRLLDVHHIDRDVDNNDPKNLVTVCRSCHLGIHGRNTKTNDKIRYFQSLLPD